MKRPLVLFVILLVAVAAGLIAAALTVPSDAAVVNGGAITQQSLIDDVSAIAGSAYYQCYLNADTYLSSRGSSQLPPVLGAGSGQNPGDHPTATSAFVANYLDTKIGHQLVYELADQRGVTTTQAQLAQARVDLSRQISQVMSLVAQSAEGGNPRYTCGATSKPLTGAQVLGTMPASFVNDQVQFVATATGLQQELAGVGSRSRDVLRYFSAHRSEFDTACFDAAVFSSKSAAQTAATAVAFGTPFSQVASQAAQSGSIRCAPLTTVAAEVGVPVGELSQIGVGKVSAPLSLNGAYVVLELTKRTPTAYAKAKSAVSEAIQRAGAAATHRVLTAAERRASVSVNPQYGTWNPAKAAVFTPLVPRPSDVLNAPANESGATQTSLLPSNG